MDTFEIGNSTARATGVASAAARRNRSTLSQVALDAALINAAFALGYYVRYELQLFRPVLDAFRAPYQDYLVFQLAYTGLVLFFLWMDGVYARRRGSSWFDHLYRIGNATTSALVILIAATFIFQPLVYSRLLLIEAGVITVVLLAGARAGLSLVQAYLRRHGVGVDRVLIVGAGEIGRAVMRNLVARPELGYQVVGFLDDDPGRGDLGRFRQLGGLENVGAVIKAERVDELIITLPWNYHRTMLGLVRAAETLGVRARVVPDLFQLSLSQVDFETLGGLPVMSLRQATLSRTGRLAKRLLDIVVAALMLVVGLPLWALVALAIRLDSRGPVLFAQKRVGEGGRVFEIFKFRSMIHGAEAQQEVLQRYNEASGPLFKMKADPRLTRVGRLLRRASLDEIPQLYNVLRGDMSLVGPRPGLPLEVAQYAAWQRQRLEVRPGITGLWQVSGRSDLSFDEMCLLDIYYIENWTVGLDLVILARTVPHVLFARGAY